MKNLSKQHRDALLRRIDDRSMVILYSGEAPHKTTDQYYFFTPNKNFHYLTGLMEQKMKLVLIKDGTTKKCYLFIEETTEYMRQWVGERMSKEEASEISGIDVKNIKYLSEFDTFIDRVMGYKRGLAVRVPKHLYLDLYRPRPMDEALSLSVFSDIIKNYKELNIMSVNEHLSYLRMFKDAYELSQLQEAIDITDKGLKRVMDELANRDNEQQIEADFLHEITLRGATTNSFNTIAASGKNATVLHYENNNEPLEDGNLILLDLGALYNNYGADISRTYPINGTFSKRQKALYNIVLDVNKATIDYVKPGLSWDDLNAFAKDLLAEKCMDIGLIDNKEDIKKYYYHSIGHFLGLDVHDVGHYIETLQEGMVLTIEPGLYVKEENIGIRIEDNILITKEGAKNLSQHIIKEVDDIEAYMKK
ncbi:MAG: aminopeptidase P family protein [Candidatus Izemoplasma sp.]|nr:aminopeptidase P family protein [Candidatus Izemoplasma sp.]